MSRSGRARRKGRGGAGRGGRAEKKKKKESVGSKVMRRKARCLRIAGGQAHAEGSRSQGGKREEKAAYSRSSGGKKKPLWLSRKGREGEGGGERGLAGSGGDGGGGGGGGGGSGGGHSQRKIGLSFLPLLSSGQRLRHRGEGRPIPYRLTKLLNCELSMSCVHCTDGLPGSCP